MIRKILPGGGVTYPVYTVRLKWIGTLCSRYTTPTPLWEQLSSSFIFIQISHWAVQIWKMSKKWIKKWRTSSASTKFTHFWVVSIRRYMVKKYLNSDRFNFLDQLFFWVLFYNSVRAFFNYLVKKESVIVGSLSSFNPYYLL